jgi:hypothetical protein
MTRGRLARWALRLAAVAACAALLAGLLNLARQTRL